MEIIEKLEQRECEMADELAKTAFTNPDYRNIAENLKTISEINDRKIKAENDRLNNNDKNDIERMKVEVEAEKVQVEKMKIKAGMISNGIADVLDLGKCCGFAWIAYNGDKVSFAIKEIMNIGRGFLRSRRH